MFLLIFTVGLSFLLYSVNLSRETAIAQQNSAQLVQTKGSESLILTTSCSSNSIKVSITNSGGVPVQITNGYVSDSNGTLYPSNSLSPPSTPALPVSINTGMTSSVTFNGVSTNCAPRTVGLVTSRGNVFTVSFPFGSGMVTLSPSFTTQGSSTVVTVTGSGFTPGQSVVFSSSPTGLATSFPTTCTTDSSGNLNPGCTFTTSTSANPGAYNVMVTAGAISGSAIFTVTSSGSPLVQTALSQDVISTTQELTNPVVDTAMLYGVAPGATGTITFYYSQTNACPAVSPTQVGVPLPVNGPGTYGPSSPVSTLASGVYYWYATYAPSGGGAFTSQCEPLVVTSPSGAAKATPTITTSLVPNPAKAGSKVNDTATFTGGASPTGTLIFAVYTSSSCSGSPAFVSNTIAVVPGQSQYVSNPPFRPSTIGTYYWEAFYTGDDANNPVTTACGTSGEILTVNPATPTVITSLSAQSLVLGQFVTDTATLVGSSGSNSQGSMAFYSSTQSNLCLPPSLSQGSGTATTAGTTTTLTDVSKTWSANQWAGFIVYITAGTDVGSTATVVSNTATTLTLSPALPAATDSTTAYSMVSTSAVSGGVATSSQISYSNTGTYYWYAAYVTGDTNNLATGQNSCQGGRSTEQLTVVSGQCVPSTGPPPVICFSTTTSGIGSISFDFNQFYYYTGTGSSCDQSGVYPTGCILTQAGRAYTIPASSNKYFAFSVYITNADPQKRTLVIDANSIMTTPVINTATSGGGRTATNEWQIGAVDASNRVIAFSPITLAYGQGATIYFVNSLDGNPINTNAWSPQVPITPVFLFFHGTIGGLSYGENFPLASILWS
jgi:hypothetical protein